MIMLLKDGTQIEIVFATYLAASSIDSNQLVRCLSITYIVLEVVYTDFNVIGGTGTLVVDLLLI